MVGVRMSEELQAHIRGWASEQEDKPPLAVAIRRLVEMALDRAAERPARYSERAAAKARELAAKTIDGLMDPSAPADEKHLRKHRLLNGPSDFREVRVDRAKTEHKS